MNAAIAIGIPLSGRCGQWLAAANQSEPVSRPPIEPTDAERIRAVLKGDQESFEPLIRKYQGRVFATVRRYAKREDEIEDIVQEVFIKSFQKLGGYRFEAPFEHWLMRLTVHTCYDFLRKHQRNRESAFSDLNEESSEWLERVLKSPEDSTERAQAARQLVNRILDQLPPAARLVITLLEIEDRSIKEIAALTGWSIPLVKVRAFRARAAMRRCLEKINREKYL